MTDLEIKAFFAEEEQQLEHTLVNYVAQVGAVVVVVENVPARVNKVTGERLFSSETTDRLLQIVRGEGNQPTRTMEASVYSFAA